MAFDLETLLQTPTVEPYGGFAVAPDGSELAFAWNRTGRWELYTLALDGRAAPVQISSGPGAKTAPAYSPDGSQLAYLIDPNGGENHDIWLWDRASGRETNLTPATPDAIQPVVSWSPDGRQIAFLSDRAGRFDAYVMPAAGGPARRVSELPYPAFNIRWSPDGRRLALVCDATGQDTRIYILPANGAGDPVVLADEQGPLCAREPAWSPTGRTLAFVGVRDGLHTVGLYTPSSAKLRWLDVGPGAQETPTWSPDGRRLAYVQNEGPLNYLAVWQPRHQTPPHEFSVGDGIHHRPLFAPASDGRYRLAFIFESPGEPPDLWKLDLKTDWGQPLTRSLPAELRPAEFVMPQQIHYPGMDGTPVPALLYRPPAARGPRPAVIWIHGGPNWLAQVNWHPLVQHLVGKGWVVLAPNYRGSIGYGRDWQLANRFDLGGVDTRDVAAGADFLVGEGLADPARVALTGRSWGGYLTMTCLTAYPDRWAAGSAVVPFLNWFTCHANSRPDLQHWDLENLGHPERDRHLYYERSPFFFLDRVQAPVQFICGAHDPRCPAGESVQAHRELVAQGKPCDLALYPDEGHVFLKRENVLDAVQRQVDFLAAALESTY